MQIYFYLQLQPNRDIFKSGPRPKKNTVNNCPKFHKCLIHNNDKILNDEALTIVVNVLKTRWSTE